MVTASYSKAKRAKTTRKTSGSRNNTRTRKKKNNIDKNLLVVIMIIVSLLLAVLIYAQSGWMGEHLSPMLGGIMGPRPPDTVSSPAQRALGYPSFTISGYSIEPIARTVAGADPERAAKNAHARTIA